MKVKSFFTKKESADSIKKQATKQFLADSLSEFKNKVNQSYWDIIEDPNGVVEEFEFRLPPSYQTAESTEMELQEEDQIPCSPRTTRPNFQIHCVKAHQSRKLQQTNLNNRMIEEFGENDFTKPPLDYPI